MRKLFTLIAGFCLLCTQLYSQSRTVTGTVTDDKGQPLAGVSVLSKPSGNGTITNAQGKFSLSVNAAVRSLEFSSVNYGDQSIAIGSRSVIDAKLTAQDKTLAEVVVIGYGTQKRKEVTGNLATVSGKAIADKPVQSFEQALGGRAAGVQITVPNGVLNNPPVIRVRGTNSISLSSFPLIVVDGVPSFSGDQGSTSAPANALSSINPDDIESIDIAKDAAASAIYGSRASNGVIFITTKKGKQGRARVSYNAWVGWTKAQRLPELLNAQEYTDFKNEALKNAGTYNATSNYFTLTPDANGNPIDTRWYDYVYRQGVSHNHNVNISGANEATNYYFSFGYSQQQGILQKNDFKRITVLGNVDHKINKVLTVGGKISFTNQTDRISNSSGSLAGEAFNSGGLARLAFVTAPSVAPYNNDGTYNTASGLIGVMNNKVGQVGFYNPVISLDLNRQNSESNTLSGNAYLQLKPFPWVSIRTIYGIDYLLVDNDIFTSGLSGEGYVANSNGGSASSNLNKNKRGVWSNTIQFDHTFNKHAFSLLGGTEQQKTNTSGFGISRTTLSDPFYTNIQGGFTNVAVASTTGNIGENYFYSNFGRLQYDYSKKYFITASIRRDGASQLGSNRKYGTFYGVSAGWEITKEKFWEGAGLDNIFSSFKLRGSYGKVGNISGLSNFGTLSTYSGGLYGGSPTLAFSNAGNPDLTWETSKKTDIGFSFGILKDKITGELTYYKNDINGLILPVTFPPSAGLPNSINTNIGSMYNKGIEAALTAVPVSKKDFRWSTTFNLALNKNRVTALAPGLNSILTASSSLETVSITLPGYSVGMIYVTRTGGIDPTTGRRIFINAAGQQVFFDFSAPAAQRYKFADGTIAPATSIVDAQIYKNTDPKGFGGFDNTFTFKNFDLNVLLTYQFGSYVYYGSNAGL